MKYTFHLLFLLTLLITGCTNSTTTAPAQRPEIYFDKISYELTVASDTLNIAVKVDNVIDLFSTAFTVVFDQEIVRYVEGSLSKGSLWENNSILRYGKADKNGLHIAIGFTQDGMEQSINGSGTVCNFKLNIQKPGTTKIEIDTISLLDEKGKPIPYASTIKKLQSMIAVSE